MSQSHLSGLAKISIENECAKNLVYRSLYKHLQKKCFQHNYYPSTFTH